MFKKYDFVFLFEVKHRELESMCLLKIEMERRGYTVKLIPQSTWYYINHRIPMFHCKVFVLPWGYNDENVKFGLRHIASFEKLVNAQWEQILYLSDQKNSNHGSCVHGFALKYAHVSWGKENAQKLVDVCGVEEIRVGKIGNMSYDFLKPELRNYYLSKEAICNELNISVNQKIILYLSSFTHTILSKKAYIEDYERWGSTLNPNDIWQTSIDNRRLTNQLFCELLDKHPEITILYRIHPVEVNYDDLLEMQNKYQNFRIVENYTVRQWVLISDQVCTWQSTSLVDAYFAGKQCFTIGYKETADELKIALYEKSLAISSYEELEEAVLNNRISKPFNLNVFDRFYSYCFEDYCSYLKMADFLENVLHDDRYKIHKNDLLQLYGRRTLKEKILRCIRKSFMYDIAFYLVENFHVKFKIFKNVQSILEYGDIESIKIQKRNYVEETEIESIENKIKQCLQQS